MRGKRIGVLMGGLSSEREVSRESGAAVLASLRARGHDATAIHVDHDVDLALRQAAVDVAFLALHGRYGEDGCVQGMLELLGIPYTGSGVLASALALDKARTKQMLHLHQVSTPSAYLLAPASELEPDAVIARHGNFGFPVVVKPVAEGSSFGVARVDDAAGLVDAVEQAARFDDAVLVERFVAGQEVSVAVLEGRALGAVEVVPRAGLHDHGDRLTADGERFFPPRVSPERYRRLLAVAERAHRALGCAGATRVDLIAGPGGDDVVLEVNTVPPLAPHGLLPSIARHAGLDHEDLCAAMLAGARLHARGRGERGAERPPRTGHERRPEPLERH